MINQFRSVECCISKRVFSSVAVKFLYWLWWCCLMSTLNMVRRLRVSGAVRFMNGKATLDYKKDTSNFNSFWTPLLVFFKRQRWINMIELFRVIHRSFIDFMWTKFFVLLVDDGDWDITDIVSSMSNLCWSEGLCFLKVTQDDLHLWNTIYHVA